MALIQVYLDKVYALFPVFLETTIFLSVDLLYRDDGRATDFDHWLVYMILAVASTSQSRSNRDQFYGDGLTYVSAALEHADEVLIPGSLYQIQALVLLVQYAMFDPAHFDSWQLIGFACRSIVDLGFHQDPPEHQQPDKKKLELRRKIFYCVYSLDRSVNLSFITWDLALTLADRSAWYMQEPFPSLTTQHVLLFLKHLKLQECRRSWVQRWVTRVPRQPCASLNSGKYNPNGTRNSSRIRRDHYHKTQATSGGYVRRCVSG